MYSSVNDNNMVKPIKSCFVYTSKFDILLRKKHTCMCQKMWGIDIRPELCCLLVLNPKRAKMCLTAELQGRTRCSLFFMKRAFEKDNICLRGTFLTHRYRQLCKVCIKCI